LQDKICTFVGSILVVVNPFRRVEGFLGVENMEKCKGKKLWNAACGPHTYSIAEQVSLPACGAKVLTQASALLVTRPSSTALTPSAKLAPATPVVASSRPRRTS